MLCSVIILFIVIFFVVFFHSYSRWHGGTTLGGGVNEGGEYFEDREVQTLRWNDSGGISIGLRGSRVAAWTTSSRESAMADSSSSSSNSPTLVGSSNPSTFAGASQAPTFDGSSQAPKPRAPCSHCGIPGHHVSKCYRLHGFPPGHQLFGKPPPRKLPPKPSINALDSDQVAAASAIDEDFVQAFLKSQERERESPGV